MMCTMVVYWIENIITCDKLFGIAVQIVVIRKALLHIFEKKQFMRSL